MSTHDYGTGYEPPLTGGTLPPVGGTTGSTQITQEPPAYGAPAQSDGGVDTAKAKASEAGSAAAEVAGSAKDSAKDVAGTAVEQGKEVAREAAAQGRQLGQELKTQVTSQVSSQQDTLRQLLSDASSELRDMSSAGSNGVATTVASQVADRTESLASYLGDRDPAAILEDLRSFARQRPGAFLLGAGLAGVIAGRFLRGVKAAADAESGDDAPTALAGGYAPGSAAGGYPVDSTYPMGSTVVDRGTAPGDTPAYVATSSYESDPFLMGDAVDLPEDPVLVRGQRDV